MRDNPIHIVPSHENHVDEEYEDERGQQYSSDSHKNSFKRKIISSSNTTKKTKTNNLNLASSIVHAPVINNRSNRYEDNDEEESDDDDDDDDDSSSGSDTEQHFASLSRLAGVSQSVIANGQQRGFIQAPHDFLPIAGLTPDAAAATNKKPRVQAREWSVHYAALVEYAKEHGHANVPKKDAYECDLIGVGSNGDDYHYVGNLGKWLNKQRQLKKGYDKTRKFPPEQEAQLQVLVDIGHLKWDAKSRDGIGGKHRPEISWPRQFAALLEYYKEYSTCNVPAKKEYQCTLVGMGENGEDYHYDGKLGQWLFGQRLSREGKRVTVLTPEREAQLQQLADEGKFSWDPRLPNWPRNYAALDEYYKEYGTCNVPSTRFYECTLAGMGENGGDYHFKGNLGKWLCDQRLAKKGMKGFHLTPERDALLQILVDEGKLLWNASALSCLNKQIEIGDATWPLHYAALLEYYKEHGTCNVPYTWSYECDIPNKNDKGEDEVYHYNSKLGLWLHNQRSRKNGKRIEKIRPDREALLQQLVDEGKLRWESYTEASGVVLPPVIPWNHHFAAMLEYCKQNGTCNVAGKIGMYECTLVGMGENGEDIPYKGKLGKWISKQRQFSRRNKGVKILKPERKAMFQQLADEGKFSWESPYVTKQKIFKEKKEKQLQLHQAAVVALETNTAMTSSSETDGRDGSERNSTGKSGSATAAVNATTDAVKSRKAYNKSSSSSSSSSSITTTGVVVKIKKHRVSAARTKATLTTTDTASSPSAHTSSSSSSSSIQAADTTDNAAATAVRTSGRKRTVTPIFAYDSNGKVIDCNAKDDNDGDEDEDYDDNDEEDDDDDGPASKKLVVVKRKVATVGDNNNSSSDTVVKKVYVLKKKKRTTITTATPPSTLAVHDLIPTTTATATITNENEDEEQTGKRTQNSSTAVAVDTTNNDSPLKTTITTKSALKTASSLQELLQHTINNNNNNYNKSQLTTTATVSNEPPMNTTIISSSSSSSVSASSLLQAMLMNQSSSNTNTTVAPASAAMVPIPSAVESDDNNSSNNCAVVPKTTEVISSDDI